MDTTSPPPIVPITAHQHIPIKLTSSNFPSWRAHLTALLNGFNLIHHLDTSYPHPSSADTTLYLPWFQQDQLLLAAIFGSLSPEILPLVPSSTTTAADAYSTLAHFFASKSRARFMQIKDDLVHASIGNQSATDFLHYIKAKADELALMDRPLSDDDLTHYVLNGLGPGYREIASSILAHDTSLSFDELHDKIVSREIYLKRYKEPQDIPIQGGGNKYTPFESSEEVVIRIPSTIVHLIDKEQSVELATGEFSIVQLKQGGNIVAALARVGDEIYWPLAKDEGAVKLDQSHYFFSLTVPSESGEINSDNILNYGLTFAAKGQEGKLRELDLVLEKFSAFRVEKAASVSEQGWLGVTSKVSPEEMEKRKEEVERSASAYWTTLAPNVEDYNGSMARMIAAGSGQVVRGILWCGDVTVDRLKWGNEFLKKRVGKCSKSEISPQALRRMQRAKKMTKMSHQVAKGILSGVVTVSGFFTSSVANSKAGQKFFSLLFGETVLASLDGFNTVRDAINVAGKNVMTTTSIVTTGLVSQKYGEDAGKMTEDGLDAAGHAIGTAWTVYKISESVNPISVIKPTTLAKAAAQATAAKLKAQSKK